MITSNVKIMKTIYPSFFGQETGVYRDTNKQYWVVDDLFEGRTQIKLPENKGTEEIAITRGERVITAINKKGKKVLTIYKHPLLDKKIKLLSGESGLSLHVPLKDDTTAVMQPGSTLNIDKLIVLMPELNSALRKNAVNNFVKVSGERHKLFVKNVDENGVIYLKGTKPYSDDNEAKENIVKGNIIMIKK